MNARTETDAELRERLAYVCGASARLHTATGPQLDVIAEEVGLKRRAVPRATTVPTVWGDRW